MSNDNDTIFKTCIKITDLYKNNNEDEARKQLYILLNYIEKKQLTYTPLINHLIRVLGIYPYMKQENSILEDRIVYELFKADIGEDETKVLHIEQSHVLKCLLDGENIGLSAPTSFGKSFIIDAFIAMKHPESIMIIVPTIALMDEYRRRITQKFGKSYNVITTPLNMKPNSQNNIYIFPQERALLFIDIIEKLDLLIIDEFYKCSKSYNSRYKILLKAMIAFLPKVKQYYFLMPNIDDFNIYKIEKDIKFITTKFNTVYLDIHHTYNNFNDNHKKEDELYNIINTKKQTLIYTQSFNELEKVVDYIRQYNLNLELDEILENFIEWFKINYCPTSYYDLFKNKCCIHNGRIHRALAQILVYLFNQNIFYYIVSTSSIIEGVNTSAENVILWNMRISKNKLDTLTYKNISGRAGRMFKYFIGNIYLFEPPHEDYETSIALDVVFDDVSIEGLPVESLEYVPKDVINKFKTVQDEIKSKLSEDVYNTYLKGYSFLQLSLEDICVIIDKIKSNNELIDILIDYNKHEVSYVINKIIKELFNKQIQSKLMNNYNHLLAYIDVISKNTYENIPNLIKIISEHKFGDKDFSLNNFFSYEKHITYTLHGYMSDLNILLLAISNEKINLSGLVSRLATSFLNISIFQLEEFGLPRMISKKISESSIIDFNKNIELYSVIQQLKDNKDKIMEISTLDSFDRYVLKYFYSGIEQN
ncbi:DEAD/DEAH box helicase [Brachyspira sp.]|uniref:DEAD/DEAH box helicase n=1 Tax=Brachyspira sp. TaxID=1977261 RepID=UPI00260E89CA|nr:DEAD/DEAH box helicase [Brachyspira sp.]